MICMHFTYCSIFMKSVLPPIGLHSIQCLKYYCTVSPDRIKNGPGQKSFSVFVHVIYFNDWAGNSLLWADNICRFISDTDSSCLIHHTRFITPSLCVIHDVVYVAVAPPPTGRTHRDSGTSEDDHVFDEDKARSPTSGGKVTNSVFLLLWHSQSSFKYWQMTPNG